MSLDNLIDQIKSERDCVVYEPDSSVLLPKDIPNDLKFFYELTDGVSLFQSQPYGIRIVGRKELKPVNMVLFSPEEWVEIKDEVSSNWFLIGLDLSGMGQYISIDFTKGKEGRCYDSFHETHALIGDSPIIAKNFTELLWRLYQHKGQHWYWLSDDFEKLGDAYD